MNKTVRKFAVGTASVALLAAVASPALAAVTDANRIAGPDRYDTAIAESAKFKADEVTTVVLANGETSHLADSIVGGKIAGAPLLFLNNDTAVQTKVKAQLAKFTKLAKVYVLGGTSALSDADVKAVLPSALTTSAVERLAGETRYGTAAAIAKVVKAQDGGKDHKNDVVYLANGITQIDALVSGQIKDDGQILLTDGSGKVPQETLDYLSANQPKTIVVLGGEKAVTPAEMEAARNAVAVTAEYKATQQAKALKAVADANNALFGYVTVATGTADDYVKTTDAVAKASTLTNVEGITKWTEGGIDDAAVQELAKSAFPKVATNLLGTSGASLYKAQFGGTEVVTKADLATPIAKTTDPNLKNSEGSVTTVYGGLSAAKTVANGNYTNANSAYGTEGATLKNALATPVTADKDFSGKVSVADSASKALWDAIKVFFPDNKVGTVTVSTDTTGKQLIAALSTNATWNEDTKTLKSDSVSNVITDIAAKAGEQVTKLKTASDKADSDYQAKVKELDTALKAYKSASDLKTDGIAPSSKRISGISRYETAVNIAKEAYGDLKNVTNVYLANGQAFADAATSGYIDNVNPSIAGPVLLVTKTEITPETEGFLKDVKAAATTALTDDKVVAFGGTSVVPDAVITAGQGVFSAK